MEYLFRFLGGTEAYLDTATPATYDGRRTSLLHVPGLETCSVLLDGTWVQGSTTCRVRGAAKGAPGAQSSSGRRYLMTPAERTRWERRDTDAEAFPDSYIQAFIGLGPEA